MVIDDTLERYIKMLESAPEIQRLCNFENGDYFYDHVNGEVKILLWYPSTDFNECIWIPRQDQYQEICINFFAHNPRLSRHDAFSRFLEWYSSCLKETAETGRNYVNNGKYKSIDSCDELMLLYTMSMLHGKKWGGTNWVKSILGYY